MRRSLSFSLLLSFLQTVSAGESLCAANEKVIFACGIGKGGKIVSMCSTPEITASTGRLYYRFGSPSNVELEFPKRPNGSTREFLFSHYTRAETSRFEVRFAIGKYSYAVFEYSDESEQYHRGVRVTADGSENETIMLCKGVVSSDLSLLEGKVPCDAESALAQCN